MIKFILFPGYVVSRRDGDSHYISGEQLANLYGVKYRDCFVVHDDKTRRAYGKGMPDDIWLHPQSNGNYTI